MLRYNIKILFALVLLSSVAIIQTTQKADYVIIGNGTAGAVLARYLSDHHSVIVIEAGPNNNDAAVLQGAPFGNGEVASDPKYSKTLFANIANLNGGVPGFAYTEGRMWGGGSAHNGMFAIRGAGAYDKWAIAAENTQWTYDNLLPYMRFLENYTPNGTILNPAQRGVGGPLNIIQDPAIVNPFLTALSVATNAPLVSDINDRSLGDVGVGMHQWYSSTTGVRSYSINAFLPTTIVDPITGKGIDGRKLTIYSNAMATRLITKKTGKKIQAKGVEYILEGNKEKILTVKATKKVIVCLGALETPKLLQLSGFGPQEVLEPLGIEVLIDMSGVGANLQNQYGTAGMVTLDQTNPFTPFQIIEVFTDLSGANIGSPDHVRRNQMYAINGGTSFFPQPGILSALGVQNIPAITLLPFNVAPKSRGTVQIVSTDPLVAPRLTFNFYSDIQAPTDLDYAVASYKVMANIAQEYGQTLLYPPVSHYPSPYGPAPDDSLLRQDAMNVYNVAYHGVGTCRMGTSISNGDVVDADLNVFGVDNLMIVDGSIQPTIEDGNTAYSVYITALKAANILGAFNP